jgi:PilZ domain
VTENRRSATRHQVAIAATVQLKGEPPIEGTIKNLSLGGGCVALGRRLTIGTPVTIGFRIPTHHKPIEATGVVRWGDDECTGIQFDGLRAGEVWALGKLFEKSPQS